MKTVKEYFSEKELRMMTEYIDDFACTQEYRTVNMEEILKAWHEAKSEYLFNSFGDELILSKEILYKKDVNEIAQDMDSICGYFSSSINLGTEDDECRAFFFKLYDKMIHLDEMQFDASNYDKNRTFRDGVNNLFTPESLASNVFDRETFEFVAPDGKTIKIQRGSKTIRIFGRLAKIFGINGFEQYRTRHSQILNQKELKGQLCLSIHPFDYMTMSDNAYGWTSCMSWMEDGCYKQGTVEMMNSPMVVVAYLKGKEDLLLDRPRNFYWNSKKWRELFIVNKEIICGIKGYPYHNEVLEEITLEWLRDIAEDDSKKINYYNDTMKLPCWETIDIEDSFEKTVPVRIHPSTNNMYNDIEHKDYIVGMIGCGLPDTEWHDPYRLKFHYSGKSQCMCCGNTNTYFASEADLVGECCRKVYYCEDCGEKYYDINELIDVDGYLYCECCYQDNFVSCGLTGTMVRFDEAIEIHAANEHGISNDIITYVDSDTFLNNPKFISEHFKRIYVGVSLWNQRTFFVRTSDLTELGVRAFEYSSVASLDNHLLKNELTTNKSSKWRYSRNEETQWYKYGLFDEVEKSKDLISVCYTAAGLSNLYRCNYAG